MSGKSNPDLQEQIKLAKELRAEFGITGTRNLRGRGGRGRRGGLHGSSGRPASSARSTQGSTSNSATSFSKSPYTARQGVRDTFPGNGGFSPSAAALTAGRFQGSTSSNALPHTRQAAQRVGISSPATPQDNGPPDFSNNRSLRPRAMETLPETDASPASATDRSVQMTNPLQDISNQPKRTVSRSGDGEAPAKRARNELLPERTLEGTAFITPAVPSSGRMSTYAMAGPHEQHTRNASNTSDVDMMGVDSTSDDGKPRAPAKKHGGLVESRWAQSATQSPAAPQAVTSDPSERMKNWIPAYVAHSTPTPMHLFQQSIRGSNTMMASSPGSVGTSSFVPRADHATATVRDFEPRAAISENSSAYDRTPDQVSRPFSSAASTSARRGGGRGGLAASKWAT
ncbi:hypothetical protein SCUP515_10615 [Seiridium cupressi]